MTSSTINCVVFDLDDTLYLERDFVKSGFCAVGTHVQEKLGVKGFASLAWAEFEVGRRGDIFNHALSALGLESGSNLISELVNVYRNHQPSIVLEPDAYRCLNALQGSVFLALVSDGPMESQRSKVRSLHLDRWIEYNVLTAELGEGFGKPHTRAFELVQERSGCLGPACVYVADNPKKDFKGPRSLGWKTFRCRRKRGLYADLEHDTIDRCEPDLARLPDFVAASR